MAATARRPRPSRPPVRTRFRRGEAGSGTVWVLALSAVVWFCAVTALVVAGVRADRHRAATAADLAALAGADHASAGQERACRVAGEVAESNGARLDACALTGHTLWLRVALPDREWPGTVTAQARAGPVLPAPSPTVLPTPASPGFPSVPDSPPRQATPDGMARR